MEDTLTISSSDTGLETESNSYFNVNEWPNRDLKDEIRSLCESTSIAESENMSKLQSSVNENVNSKSELQELLQTCGISLPQYENSCSISGQYESTVIISDLDIQFKGPAKANKKTAEKSAAFSLLEYDEFKSKLDSFRNG